jgi:hypothetical protein
MPRFFFNLFRGKLNEGYREGILIIIPADYIIKENQVIKRVIGILAEVYGVLR